GAERFFPDAAFARRDALAMSKRGAGHVRADAAIVTDDDADIADRYDGLGNQLDGGKPAVDEIRSVGESRILSAAASSSAEVGFGVLEVVVVVGGLGVIADL